MKKILGGVLVLLSLVLLGSVKAETLDELGEREVEATIGNIEVPTYDISLTWESFEYDYLISGLGGYRWSGNPTFTILNESNVPVAASFDWEAELEGTGILLMHMNAACTEAGDDIDYMNVYLDSECNLLSDEHDANGTYYVYQETGETWLDSLTSGTTYYNDYINMSGQGTANGSLVDHSFIISGDKLVASNGDVIWAPTYEVSEGVVFNLSLADTVRSRDLSNLHTGDTIGTLTITIDDVE